MYDQEVVLFVHTPVYENYKVKLKLLSRSFITFSENRKKNKEKHTGLNESYAVSFCISKPMQKLQL